jgi:acetyl-CoA carboxylase carboxyltransferase component
MAVIAHTVTALNDRERLVTWATATEADTFDTFTFTTLPQEISVHVKGTFGGATVVLAGANSGTPTATLAQTSTSAASCTAEDMFNIIDTPRYIAPTHSGGSSESVSVYMWVKY